MIRGKIPKELFDFFTHMSGRSLIIRGPAGTGKTTLALETLDKMRREMNTYYLTARVTDTALYDHFPWLKQMAEEGEMMKVVKEMEKLALKKDIEKKIPRVDRAELKKLEGFIEAGGESMLTEDEDFTLTVGSQLVELDMIYDVVEKALPKSTLIVIDPVEGIAEKYGVTPNKLMLTIQKDLVENARAKVIFVVETAEPVLDYLADGVVHMNMSIVNNRTARVIEIRKLRGMRIEQCKYVYTLEGGRFTVLEPPQPADIAGFDGFEEEVSDKFSVGIQAVDATISGLKRREVILNLLCDNGITISDQYLFTKRIIATHLMRGTGVYYMPSKIVDTKEFLSYLSTNKTCAERLNTHLRLLMLHTLIPQISEMQENIVPLEGTGLSREITPDVLKSNMEAAQLPYLFIIDADALYSTYSNLSAADIMEFIRLIRSTASNCIFITYADTPDAISQLADISLRFTKIEAMPVIAGEFPHTPYYGFNITRIATSPRSGSKPEQKGIKVRMIPIV